METNGLYYLELNVTVRNNRIAEVRYPPEASGVCYSPLRQINLADKGGRIVNVCQAGMRVLPALCVGAQLHTTPRLSVNSNDGTGCFSG